MVLEKTLESPLDCKESILKEISPGCSLEGLMLKLKLQYSGHLVRRVDSLEKTLMLGGVGGTGWYLIVVLISIFLHPKGDQSWVFIGRTDAEAETPILWPPHANS